MPPEGSAGGKTKVLVTVILTVTLNPSLDKTYSVPGFAVGRDVVAARVERSPGGKGLNVASFARALGAEVLATGILAGHTGRQVEELLAERGIARDFVWVSGETRSCHIIHVPDANTLSQIREPGPEVPREARAPVAAKVRALAARARLVVMSGSLPPGLETDLYRELVAIVRAQQVPVILDAAGEPLELGLHGQPTLIKPNFHELKELAQRLGIAPDAPGAEPGAEPDAVRRWAAATGRVISRRYQVHVVASLGPLGAVVADGQSVYAVVPPPIEAVNTISCGDALVAGIAVAWTRGQPLADGVRLGVAVATAKAQRFATGTVDPAHAARLLPQVRTLPLSDSWS